MSVRDSIIDALQLLASPSKQLDYERSLTTAGDAPTELVSSFCDDLYHPKSQVFISAFSSDELCDLAHLYGLIIEASYTNYPTVSDMLKEPKWRRVVAIAKELSPRFESAA